MKYLKLKKEITGLKSQIEDLEYKLYWSKKEIERSKEEIKALEKKQKESNVISISMNKEDVDSIVKKVTENILGKQEHKCTPECFKKHVIKAIQNDYDSIDSKNNKLDKLIFINYWHEKLSEEYPWLKCLYIIDDKIYFESK